MPAEPPGDPMIHKCPGSALPPWCSILSLELVLKRLGRSAAIFLLCCDRERVALKLMSRPVVPLASFGRRMFPDGFPNGLPNEVSCGIAMWRKRHTLGKAFRQN